MAAMKPRLKTETSDPRPWVEWADKFRRAGSADILPEHGSWEEEPDLARWIDDATGLPCMISRNRMGAWCGYVCVRRDHRFWGVSYNSPETFDIDALDNVVAVHGGLTFSGSRFDEGDWWFGFDCNHAWDIVPGMPNYGVPDEGSEYRTMDYAIAQTELLARQLFLLNTKE